MSHSTLLLKRYHDGSKWMLMRVLYKDRYSDDSNKNLFVISRHVRRALCHSVSLVGENVVILR